MLRVLVVEERQAVRDGLKRLLAGAGEITVVGEASGTAEGVLIARRLDCDLLVLGMALPGPEALEEMRRLKEELPGLPVLAVGAAVGADRARATVAQGASGYLDISRAREDLIVAIRTICRGSVFVSPPAREGRGGRAPAAR
jgi:DNA-binding NarL/FixJ family response regulator